jgi:hypothetical protein
MRFASIYNQYLLYLLFKLKNRPKLIHIKEHDNSFIYLDDTFIKYALVHENIRYEMTISYIDREAYDLAIYVFVYSSFTELWHHTMGLYYYECTETFNSLVMSQLQHYFRKIHIDWDSDKHYCPWLYDRVITYHQTCTSKVRSILRTYRLELQGKINRRKYLMMQKAFTIWKEWYYDPNNPNGYVKRITRHYGWTNSNLTSFD